MQIFNINFYDLQTQLNTAQATANAAMPKSGGVAFTGNVAAYGSNRTGKCLRNIEVYNSAHSEYVSTNMLVAVRK